MKKLLSIVALCLIAILAGTIIVFSCVDKDNNINLKNPDYIEILVNKQSGVPSESYYKDDAIAERKEIYDDIIKLYNASFKQKIMSGIFQGILFDKVEVVRNRQSLTSILSNGTFIAFNYYDDQSLSLKNKNYVYKNVTTSAESIPYKTIYVEVKNTDAMTDINIYIKNKESENDSTYRIVVKTKQASLYNYIQENFAD